jgi:hypothetical protein
MLSTYQWIYLSVKKKWYAYKFASLCQYMLLKWHCTFLSKLISTPILYAILCIFLPAYYRTANIDLSIIIYNVRTKHIYLLVQHHDYLRVSFSRKISCLFIKWEINTLILNEAQISWNLFWIFNNLNQCLVLFLECLIPIIIFLTILSLNCSFNCTNEWKIEDK